jgi:hypothetical protein
MEEKHLKLKEKAGFAPPPTMFGEAPVTSLAKPKLLEIHVTKIQSP